jgi:phosphatidylinositol alpha-1,6-mannosyltransferase
MLLSAEALGRVGRLDADYFVYFEDADWFARAAGRGLKALVVPRSVVWHKESRLSAQAKSVYSSYYFARNRLEFVRRNYARWLVPALAAGLRYGILNNLARRRWHHLAAALRGTADFILGRRGMVIDPGGARLLPTFLMLSADYKPQPGGIAEHAFKVARSLAARGAEVTVLAPAVAGARRFDGEHGFRTYRVPRIPGAEAAAYFMVGLYAVLRHRIGVVYVATSHPCALVCRLLRILIDFRFTVTVHAHEVVYAGKSLRSRLKSVLRPLQIAAIASGDRVFAVSDFTRQALVNAGVPDRKIATIYNGIDVEDLDIDVDVPGVVSRLGLGGKRVILTVARLDIHKGHDVVLRALPSIARAVPDVVYVIVGEGGMRPRLEALARELGLADRVVFTGSIPRTDVVALFKACDVFVMLSRIEGGSAEGFGIVFLEAGALGKPVVGGRAGGIPDAVEDGVTGLLVDPLSPEDGASAITRILLDRALAARLGAAGSERTRTRFTWNKVVDSILASLNEPAR